VVSFFKERSVPSVFAAVFVCIALHAFFLIQPPTIVTSPSDGLMYYVLQPFVNLPAIALPVIYFAVVIVQALRINNVLNETRMFAKTPFTAALAYILLTALWPAFNNITPALLVNSLLIWVLFRIVKLYNTSQPKALIYNIGIISGAAALLYYPAMGIIPVVFIALGITRAFRINEWMVLLLGIITPLYFWGGYLFLTDQLDTVKIITSLFKWHVILGPVKPIAIAFGAAGLLLLCGIVRRQGSGTALIQVRKIWAVLFCMLIFLLPAVFFIKNAWPNALLLACVPGAAVAANAFLYPKGVVSVVLFWVMAAAIVYVNWLAV